MGAPALGHVSAPARIVHGAERIERVPAGGDDGPVLDLETLLYGRTGRVRQDPFSKRSNSALAFLMLVSLSPRELSR